MKALLGGVQSHFSFHWGTASPAAWFRRVEELGYTHLGIADNAAVHGLPEIVRQAETSPVTPLYGAAFRFADGRSVVAYVETPLGYGNLCQRITRWQDACASRSDGRAGGVPAIAVEAVRPFFADPALIDGLAFIVDDLETWRNLRAAGAEAYWRVGPTLAAPPRGVPPDATLFMPGPVLLAPDDFDTHRLLRAVGGATTLDRMPTAGQWGVPGLCPSLLMAGPDSFLRAREEYAATFAPYVDAIERADALAVRLGEFVPCRDMLHPPCPIRSRK